MRRTPLDRVFAAVVLLWFAFITGGPAALHSCPVHDDARAPVGAATHDAHSHQLPDSHDHSSCTCLGDCTAGGVAPVVPAARAALAHVTEPQVRAPLPQPDSPALAAPAFLLPCANGPPGARRVA
jgi:hypothetical protein